MSLNQIEQAQGLRVRSTQDLAGGLFMILLAVGAFAFSWDLPAGTLEVLEGHGFDSIMYAENIELPAWSGFFARFA